MFVILLRHFVIKKFRREVKKHISINKERTYLLTFFLFLDYKQKLLKYILFKNVGVAGALRKYLNLLFLQISLV